MIFMSGSPDLWYWLKIYSLREESIAFSLVDVVAAERGMVLPIEMYLFEAKLVEELEQVRICLLSLDLRPCERWAWSVVGGGHLCGIAMGSSGEGGVVQLTLEWICEGR
jgi:hypothetical protein